MNPNFWKIGTIVLAGILLVGAGVYLSRFLRGTGSRSYEVNQFITKESHFKALEECWQIQSKDNLCAFREAIEKADGFCKKNSISDSECEKIRVEVAKKGLEYSNLKSAELQDTTDKIRQMTDKLKREQLRKSQ